MLQAASTRVNVLQDSNHRNAALESELHASPMCNPGRSASPRRRLHNSIPQRSVRGVFADGPLGRRPPPFLVPGTVEVPDRRDESSGLPGSRLVPGHVEGGPLLTGLERAKGAEGFVVTNVEVGRDRVVVRLRCHSLRPRNHRQAAAARQPITSRVAHRIPRAEARGRQAEWVDARRCPVRKPGDDGRSKLNVMKRSVGRTQELLGPQGERLLAPAAKAQASVNLDRC